MVTRQDPLHPMGPLWACSYSDRKNWEKEHDRHLGAIKDMKGCLDHKPPWRDDRLFDNLKRAKKWYVADKGAEIARENKLLVDKLYTISKNSYVNQQAIRRGEPVSAPGVRHSIGHQEVKTGGKVHDALRRRNAGTIEMDNEMLVNRILNVKKTIDTKSFEKDFKVHLHYSALRSNMPKDMSMRKSSSAPEIRKPKPTGDGTRGFLIPGDLSLKKAEPAALSIEEEGGGPPKDGAIFLPSLTGP
jgi:hypothetical protein